MEDVQVIVSIHSEATGDITYEETNTTGLHQLVLNCSEKDPLEIGVIYRNHGCIKETTAKFKSIDSYHSIVIMIYCQMFSSNSQLRE